MNDWQHLPAGPELNRLIAERSGWQVEQITPVRSGIPYLRFVLREPEGWRPVLTPHQQYVLSTDPLFGSFNSPNEAWARVPNFSGNTDMALRLFLHQLLTVSSYIVDEDQIKWQCCVGDTGWPCSHADSPALAICRAWLEVKELGGG